jgi:hypothetical protein
MTQQDDMILDIREALGAMTGDYAFAEAGIDQAFIEMFSRNIAYFDQLPASTREKIRDQFFAMSTEQSHRTGVGHGKTNEDKSRAMAEWFKSVNLLLAMAKKGMT